MYLRTKCNMLVPFTRFWTGLVTSVVSQMRLNWLRIYSWHCSLADRCPVTWSHSSFTGRSQDIPHKWSPQAKTWRLMFQKCAYQATYLIEAVLFLLRRCLTHPGQVKQLAVLLKLQSRKHSPSPRSSQRLSAWLTQPALTKSASESLRKVPIVSESNLTSSNS